MTKLTNSRGFIVEMSSAAIVMIGSRYGLPLSTTHCLVGAVTGVGIVETVSGRKPANAGTDNKRAFNFLLLLKFFCGWVATLIITGLTSAAFTAQVRFADLPASRRMAWLVQTAWAPVKTQKPPTEALRRCCCLPAGFVRSLQDRHRPARVGRQGA